MKYALLFIAFISCIQAQVIPSNRTCDWSFAGIKDSTTVGFQDIYLDDLGAVSDGSASNSALLQSILDTINQGSIIHFGNGTYLFQQQMNVNSNTLIRGLGADSTTLQLDLGGSDHAIRIQGSIDQNSTVRLTQNALTGNTQIEVQNAQNFAVGDWIQISQSDSDLVSSSWAERSVGQILQVQSINQNTLQLTSPLRLDLPLSRSPEVQKLDPSKNIGFECFALERIDDTAPQQSSNFYIQRGVNIWLKGIESAFCTFAHVDARNSANLAILNSYFHEGFSYGGGGRAYGVMLHFTTNEVLVENNVFETLRHAMILQAGANGNVFAYNYSTDAKRDEPPSEASGDMVLHGNYPFLNLFEQNICQNIAIDNSHDANGPYNTFFRNRAESWGIFFNDASSPSQNLVGNEISNDQLPFNLLNYTISGADHFIYGNNNKGTADPAGTESLSDLSYFYSSAPSFLSSNQFAGIGYPNSMEENSVPAKLAFDAGDLNAQLCGDFSFIDPIAIEEGKHSRELLIYPNPFRETLHFKIKDPVESISIYTIQGIKVLSLEERQLTSSIHLAHLSPGVYVVRVFLKNQTSFYQHMIKTQ